MRFTSAIRYSSWARASVCLSMRATSISSCATANARLRNRTRTMAALGDIVEQALAVHQTGQLEEAQRLYLSVLVEQPNNFDALHLLGVLKYQRGELAESLRLIEAALALEPNAPRALSNRALVLGTLGRTTEALASYERA